MNAVLVGALLAALGVLAGAFGAHGLKSQLTPDKLQIFDTGVRYHLIHALALVLVGLLARQGVQDLGTPAWLFASGVLLFSGSLYALALGAPSFVGFLTPLGGLMFLGGWVLLALAARGR
ncbi:MAG: DUF423 domain-containing protein [Planctomycetota bacterium]